MTAALDRSQALWNRAQPDLRSDEQLAQWLDRGELAAWRELYALAKTDPEMRNRIGRLLNTAPLPFAGFWRAALASLGESIDWSQPLPEYKDL